MEFRAPPAWPFRQGGSAEPRVMQPPARLLQVIDRTYWDETSPVSAEVVAAAIVRQNIPNIMGFIQRQRLNYNLGVVPIGTAWMTLPQLTVKYMNQSGYETITYIVQPTAVSGFLPGDFVLVQLTVTGQNIETSGPSGTFWSFAVDPDNGTEVPATVAIGGLIEGAQIVYQKIDLQVTPVPSYYLYLADPASTQVITTVTGPNTGIPYNYASMYAYLSGSGPGTPQTVQVGYNQYVNGYEGSAGANGADSFQLGTAAATASGFNAGGSAYEPGGIGGYSDGAYDYSMTLWYTPWLSGIAYYYTATLTATWVIQLPQILGALTKPAFSVETTGYPWNATISIFPSKGITVDKTHPSFPLKWITGSPPPGAGGGAWSPRGVPDTNIQDAYLWQIFYEDAGGTAVPTSYPFVVTYQPHLSPPATITDPINMSNDIMQLYPTFLSGLEVFGYLPNDWYVVWYADVPYGRQFQPPNAWGYTTNLTTVGPVPLIATDVPRP